MRVEMKSHNGYGDAARALGTPRSIEHQVFSQATGRLRRGAAPDAPFGELVAALHENLRLWSTIAIDVASDENALPDLLRAQLFYLYEFTAAETQRVLRQDKDASVLIEINTNVMRGLRGDPGTGEG